MTETTKRTTKVWAHRGASGYRPENTLEAFELAIRQGADGIELDVHTSVDGELIVMHDENAQFKVIVEIRDYGAYIHGPKIPG